MEKKLEVLYKVLRMIVYLVPVFAVIFCAYLILFPVETYRYYADHPEPAKFEIEKDSPKNELVFGAFPAQNHRFVDLAIKFKKTDNQSCSKENPEISVLKSYRAFLFPEDEPVKSKEDLKDIVFFANMTKYPNGSLLHLKPTDEVFVITNGKKTLFPGPEIFRAFGYSFDNLIDVDKSTLDQFPNAETNIFFWNHPHPDGTIFQSFPSQKLYIIFSGRKHLIEKEEYLREIRPDFFAIVVSDADLNMPFPCQDEKQDFSSGKLKCRFDSFEMAENIGGYYYFIVSFPATCPVENIKIKDAKISFISEKKFSTAKESLRNIFISVLNRYLYKQNI